MATNHDHHLARQALYIQRRDQAERRFETTFHHRESKPFDFQQFRFSQLNSTGMAPWVSFDRRARAVVERCYLQRYREDNPIPYFHWVSMAQPNAFASTDGEFDIVAFSKEMWLAVFGSVNALFAHPKAFASVGNVELESPPANPGTSMLGGKGSIESLRFPNCPVRLQVASQVIIDLTDFLIEHELQHLLRGHAGYMNAQYSLPASIHLPSNAIDTPLNGLPISMFHQAVETQADGPALTICIKHALFDHYPSRDKLIQAGMPGEIYDELKQTIRPDQKTRIYWFFVALHIFFGVLSRERGMVKLGARTHPPSWARGLMASTTLKATLINNNELPDCRDDIGRLNGLAMGRTAEAARAAFVGDGIDYSPVLPPEEFSIPYYETIGNVLAKLQPEFERHQRDSSEYHV